MNYYSKTIYRPRSINSALQNLEDLQKRKMIKNKETRFFDLRLWPDPESDLVPLSPDPDSQIRIHIKMIQIFTAASNDNLNILGVSELVRFLFLWGNARIQYNFFVSLPSFFSLRESIHYMNPFLLNMHICLFHNNQLYGVNANFLTLIPN